MGPGRVEVADSCVVFVGKVTMVATAEYAGFFHHPALDSDRLHAAARGLREREAVASMRGGKTMFLSIASQRIVCPVYRT